MAINTHGLKIIGLEDASKETVTWGDRTISGHNEILYDRDTGEVWAKFLTGDSWTQCNDPAVVLVCRSHSHMSAQAIADAIAEARGQALQYLEDAKAQGMDDYTIGLLQDDVDRWRRAPTC